MVSRGLYDMQQSFAQYDNAFDRFGRKRDDRIIHRHSEGGDNAKTQKQAHARKYRPHTSSGALYAINQNLFYGLKEISSRVKDTGSDISTLDTHIQSGFSVLDSHFVSFSEITDLTRLYAIAAVTEKVI